MKFENILHIYWTKGLFASGKLYTPQIAPQSLITSIPGVGPGFSKALLSRFEVSKPSLFLLSPLKSSEKSLGMALLRPLNIVLSQFLSVNNSTAQLKRLKIIRQFLLKTYKGRSHSLGKPVRGQRTWSNAWSSYRYNTTLRFFLSSFVKNNRPNSDKKVNFKVTAKKYAPSARNTKTANASNKNTHSSAWY